MIDTDETGYAAAVMTGLDWTSAVLAAGVMAFGALVQGSVGFGSALLAAPLLLLIDPVFVPAPLIMAACAITVLVVVRERRELNLRAVGWAVAGRVPGTGLGVLALRALPATQLGVLFAALILLAVGMMALGRAPARTRTNLFLAGLLAGVMGTVTSVGGPPIALMFHDARGPELRGTLGGYFLMSTVIGLGGLWLAGLLGMREIAAFIVLLPGVLVGFALSQHTRRVLDRGYTRPAVLALASTAAILVLVKHL